MDSGNTVTDNAKDYYGQVLGGSGDLQTSACCPADALPAFARDTVSYTHLTLPTTPYV